MAQAPPRRLLRPRDHPPARGPRLRLLRRRRRAGRRARGARAHPRARHPAGLEGRLDLPVPERPPAGDGHRRRRPQAVPLPRRLAHPPRRREVRRHDALRPRAAAAARAGRGRPRRDRRARPASACWPARCGCSTAASSASAPRSTRCQRVLRPGDDAQGARDASTDGADGLRLPGQERPAPHPGGRRPAGAARSCARSSAAAAAAPELLAYKHGRRWCDVRSDDINAYLKEATGDDFSAKDFRTWSATVLAAVALAVSGPAHGTKTVTQARDHPRDQGDRALPRQHARGLPRVLHRPARLRRLPTAASCSTAGAARRGRTPSRRAADPPPARSSRRCST